MVKQFRARRPPWTPLVLAALAGALLAAAAAAQAPLRWGRNDPGNARPIALAADEVTTWQDAGRRIFLLKGKVSIEQGEVQAHAQQAVVWIDEQGQKTSGLYHLDIYAEGDVTLADGAKSLSGAKSVPKALLELNTRGTVPIRSYLKKFIREPLPRDPLYLNAVAERTGPPPAPPKPPAPPPPAPPPPPPPAKPQAAAPAQGIVRVSAQELVPVVPVQPVQGLPPQGAALPVPPVPPAPPNPGAPPAPGAIPELPRPRPFEPTPGPAGPPRQVIIRPRSSEPIKACNYALANGETAVVVSSGVIVTIIDASKPGVVDIEADRLVTWTRGGFEQLFKESQTPQPHTEGQRELEFYLAGHVEIRQQSAKETRILRADEVYYDFNRSVAIARDADLEVKQPGLPDAMHLQGPELLQLSPKLYQLGKSQVAASKLPYDPQLRLTLSKATLEEVEAPKRGLFGLGPQRIDPKTGQPITEHQDLFRGNNAVVWIGPIPVFYLPYVQGDARDPLGPLQSLGFNYNKIFGFATYTTLNVYNLLGLTPNPGDRWRLNVDYLSERGLALGTEYSSVGRDLFGLPSRYNFDLRAYGIDDSGDDIIGGDRGNNILVGSPPTAIKVTHPELRGRLTSNLNWQELPYGFTVQARLGAISDKNFMEQYYNYEWNSELNLETILYVKQQMGNWAWTAFGQAHLRNWITETEWMPKVDGYLIGQKFFDLVTYNTNVEAGYAHLVPTHQPPGPISVTDQNVATARLNWGNELALPFSLGDLRVVPYLTGTATYYSEDIDGNERTRVLGGGGIRSSLPLSHLYPDAQSEFFNVNGIFHKIVFSSNYYNVHSDTPYTQLPQLDRLNDDTTDQALRDIKAYQPLVNPAYGAFLANSPVFQPQTYAIRNLVDNRIDTLDSIEVLQGEIRQRWQTKRGYPEAQHIVDWMTLDLSGSWFPSRVRDNFGEDFGLLKYDWTWHVGDRFTLLSDGWYEPVSHGPRVFNFGTQVGKPDGASFYLAYTSIDPLNTRNVTASITFPFSPKYSMSASSSYDFGNNIQVNSLTVTRNGTDLQVIVGINYNSILSTVGFTFEIFPNLVPAARRIPGSSGGLFNSLSSPH